MGAIGFTRWCRARNLVVHSSNREIMASAVCERHRSSPWRTRKVVCSQDERDDRALKEAFNLLRGTITGVPAQSEG
jgi:hypothetical protein